MKTKKRKRQKIRRLTLLVSLLLFPITMWYFSPAIIITAMMQHVLNGSFFVFLLMLLASMFLGRGFCGYVCPAGGLQECVARINDAPAKQKWRNRIKYVIWVVWIGAIVVSFLLGKGEVTADVFFMTEHGISISEIQHYIIYYLALLALFLPALVCGRRASCHYICWMAPFMIIGEKLGRLLHLPQIHVTAQKDRCISCKKCNGVCPMGLDVEQMVHTKGSCIDAECIQCGACVDECPKKALAYSWKAER